MVPMKEKTRRKAYLNFTGFVQIFVAVPGKLVYHVCERFVGGVKFLGREARYGFAELTLIHEGRG